MKKFMIDPCHNIEFGYVNGEFAVHADNIHKAADVAARRIFRKPFLIAHRKAFVDDQDGMFVAFDPSSDNLFDYIGSFFHVRLVDETEGK